MPRAKTKPVRHGLPPGRRTRRRPGQSVEEHPALQAIWDVVAQIPRGKVTTYGDVAVAAGLPGRARQVGYALRHSPNDLPWFRVLGAGGRIVFPPGSRYYVEQTRRLTSEGVKVERGRVERAALFDPSRD
jgi:methylated-DNA-protein-cysteine methyltransferase-like protein